MLLITQYLKFVGGKKIWEDSMVHKLAVNMSSSSQQDQEGEPTKKPSKIITASTCDCMLYLGESYETKEDLKKWLVFSMQECTEVLDHE